MTSSRGPSHSPGSTTYDAPSAISLVSLAFVELIAPALADAGGDIAEELIDERPDPILDVAPLEVGAQEPHAAIDVVADAARGDHAPFLGVGRGHAADAKAIAPVNVGHGQAGLLDAGQGRHVDDLLGPLVLLDLLDQLVVGEDDAVDPHVGAIALGNPPLAGAGRLERTLVSFVDWLIACSDRIPRAWRPFEPSTRS